MKEIEQLKTAVQESVNKFIVSDSHLLKINAHEQTISHRIALYLENFFNNDSQPLHVDCEYNRREESIKKLISNLSEFKGCCCNNRCKKVTEQKDKLVSLNIRPDIIVHSRGDNKNNKIIIEIKKSALCNFDLFKLKEFTKMDNEYDYQLGCFIYFPEYKAEYKWFINGEEESLSTSN